MCGIGRSVATHVRQLYDEGRTGEHAAGAGRQLHDTEALPRGHESRRPSNNTASATLTDGMYNVGFLDLYIPMSSSAQLQLQLRLRGSGAGQLLLHEVCDAGRRREERTGRAAGMHVFVRMDV